MLKKVFAATLAGLFITAPAFANIENYGADKEAYENSEDFVGVKMSGSFFIKGNARDINGKDYSAYESDFEVKTNFVVSEKTSATLVVEALDTNWVGNAGVSGGDTRAEGQNYLEVTKATMNHTFDTGTTFYGGVAGDQDSWGTDFGDLQSRGYFVQIDQALSMGTLTLKAEKINEGIADGVSADKAIENDDLDKDGYLVGFSMDAGGFKIQPAVYVVDDQASKAGDLTKLILAASGKVGAIELTTEFGYNDADAGSAFGAWVDAATTVAGLGMNFSVLYSGTDDAFSFSDDGANLCPMEILGDEFTLSGSTLIRAKVSKSITDKIGVDASFAYAYSNLDDKYQSRKADEDDAKSDSISEGDNLANAAAFESAYEVDLNASYKASDAVTLSCGIAYIDGDNAKGVDTAQAALNEARTDAYAKIAVAF